MAENQSEKEHGQALCSKTEKDGIKPACAVALVPIHFTVKLGCSEPFPHISQRRIYLTGPEWKRAVHHREGNHSKKGF